MCTALSFKTSDLYFGRTLDLDRSYGEEVCIAPRSFPFELRTKGRLANHHAIIGMATVAGGVPLFYDAVNEYGLAMAGLNFPGNAYYAPLCDGKDNIAPFEVIPWLLGRCKTLSEARVLLERINIADISFSEKMPNSPLHWMMADRGGSIVIEAMRDGLHIHDNPIGVLTNNPPFEHQLNALKKYSSLRNDNLDIQNKEDLPYSDYCQGLGAVGLPGDLSSMSRFARAAFGRENSVCGADEASSVGQFFHILSSVEMIRGACKTDEGTYDITVYTSCMNADKGIYYYTTYENRRISAVRMHSQDLGGEQLYRCKLIRKEDIEEQ